MVRIGRSCSVVLLVGALASCAGTPGVATDTSQKAMPGPPVAAPVTTPVAPEVALKERVIRFWQARLKDDIARLYDFLEPEVKERVSLTAYVRSQGTIHFLSYEILSIDIIGEKAWVKVKYTFKVRVAQLSGFGPWSQESREVWILQGDVWYRPFDQKEGKSPPPGIS